jgi:hypothetical protein
MQFGSSYWLALQLFRPPFWLEANKIKISQSKDG